MNNKKQKDVHLCWLCEHGEHEFACEAYEEMVKLSEKYIGSIEISFRVTACDAFKESKG